MTRFFALVGTVLFLALGAESIHAQDLSKKPSVHDLKKPLLELPKLEIPQSPVVEPQSPFKAKPNSIDPGIFLSFKQLTQTPMPIFEPKGDVDPGIILKLDRKDSPTQEKEEND
jgi:hypothetical protein